ncbi:50S ribosomal protein L19 [Patescibacteria group bacterium]|nr:MAG: 50S ribosomal protein L19 [Patescibacteria group bacterium]
MYQEVQEFQKNEVKKKLSEIRSGDTVKVHQRIKEKGKERVQVFEGLVIAVKGSGPLARRITVRRVTSGVGVERIFPLNSQTIKKIEVVKRSRVRRAKLYYMRKRAGRSARLDEREGELPKAMVEEVESKRKGEKGKVKSEKDRPKEVDKGKKNKEVDKKQEESKVEKKDKSKTDTKEEKESKKKEK